MERTADDLELAGQIHEDMNQAGRRVAEAANAPQEHPKFDGLHCVEPDCGVELPGIRLAYKKIRCTVCQTRIETEARRRR